MITYFKPLVFIIIIILLNSCFDNNPSANFIVDNDVVLRINDEKVSSKQFKKMFVGQKKIFKVQNIQELKPEELTWFKNRVLDEIVKKTLLSQEIAKNNITINQNKLDEVLSQKREGYVGGALKKTLALEKISRDDWENSIKNTLLINKLIHKHVNSKVSVSEKEMRKYFDKSKSANLLDDDVIKYIVTSFTKNEKGVRELLRSIETIYMKINLLRYL